MLRAELAKALDGREYLQELTLEETESARDNSLVVIFGGSDDLMEFRGAIYDELDAYGGKKAYLNNHGIIENKCDCGDECPNFKPDSDAGWIEATFKSHWEYKTKIPHNTFKIIEDDELYCIGIVIDLEDLDLPYSSEE